MYGQQILQCQNDPYWQGTASQREALAGRFL